MTHTPRLERRKAPNYSRTDVNDDCAHPSRTAASGAGRPARTGSPAAPSQADRPDGPGGRDRPWRNPPGAQLRGHAADDDQRGRHPRHRHPRDPGRVRTAGRTGHLDLVRHRRPGRAAVRRVLRRNGRPGASRGLQLLLHVRHHGRGHGLGLRLVPRARIRRFRRRGRSGRRPVRQRDAGGLRAGPARRCLAAAGRRRPGQHPGHGDCGAGHGPSGPRRQGKRVDQHRYRAGQGGHPGLLLRRGLHRLQRRPLRTAPADGGRRRLRCRLPGVLLLHRLRRRLHRGRGSPQPQARPAPGHHALHADRHHHLRAGCRCRHRRPPVGLVRRHRSCTGEDPGGNHRPAMDRAGVRRRRRARHCQHCADSPLRTDPHPSFHVPRRTGSPRLWPRLPPHRHPRCRNVDRGNRRRPHRRAGPARGARRRHQHRHPVRLRPGERGRHLPSPHPAGAQADLPGSPVPADTDPGSADVRLPDGQPGRRNVGDLRDLDARGTGRLLRLRQAALAGGRAGAGGIP